MLWSPYLFGLDCIASRSCFDGRIRGLAIRDTSSVLEEMKLLKLIGS